MKATFGIAVAALFGIGLTASVVDAQCNITHPKKATTFRSRLVQAMLPCNEPGGNVPNTTTEGGVPACQPPETFNEDAGSPANGWVWGPQSDGSVTIKATNNKYVNILNPLNAGDLAIKLQLN